MPKKKPGGQIGNPGRTPEAEVERRVSECRVALESHFTKGEIKKQMKEKYGVDARTVENYLSRAREQIVQEVAETREYLRSQSVAVYRRILRSPDSTAKDKIMAQRQIDHILGLHAPWKVAQTDTDGKDISPDEARARVSDLARGVLNRIGASGASPVDKGD